MDVASLVLGIPGFVQSCTELGSSLITTVQRFAESDNVKADVAQKLRARWNILQHLFTVLENASPYMGTNFQQDVLDELNTLRRHLQATIDRGNTLGIFSNPDTAKIQIWEDTELKKLLLLCDEWQSVINCRLLVVLTSAAFDHVPREATKSIIRLAPANANPTELEHPPIDFNNIEPLPRADSVFIVQQRK
jgi:hypothetical protein